MFALGEASLGAQLVHPDAGAVLDARVVDPHQLLRFRQRLVSGGNAGLIEDQLVVLNRGGAKRLHEHGLLPVQRTVEPLFGGHDLVHDFARVDRPLNGQRQLKRVEAGGHELAFDRADGPLYVLERGARRDRRKGAARGAFEPASRGFDLLARLDDVQVLGIRDAGDRG